MALKLTPRLAIVGAIVLAIVAMMGMLAARAFVGTPGAHAAAGTQHLCDVRPQFCTETAEPWNLNGQYTGHDEPSLLYYSNVPGSGNSNLYQLTLPTDPVAAPTQGGGGTTWNFQLHPAFWFGMALCDDQAAPNPGVACPADSDSNIYKSTNPHSADYIGLTPGTAFLEMQFYPPGWGPVSCTDAFGNQDGKWCAALNIDSVQSNSNTGQANNDACNNLVGPEPVNYAIVTKDGVPVSSPRPDNSFGNQAVVTSDTLEFNNGDQLAVDMHDTAAGLTVIINDVTTGQSGFMTASAANGFGHALSQPSANTCTMANYSFHPMFSTSSPDTRVLWAAHSYNVAFSDEIGHFEYFREAATRDPDDVGCFRAPVVSPAGATIGLTTGCLGSDGDFDGSPYVGSGWPGGPGAVAGNVSTPIQFTSPLFTGPGNSGLWNYKQVAFETDLPRIEGADTSTTNNCQRHVSNPADPSPGSGCINPPNGANGTAFYPIYSTTTSNGSCIWQEGGANLPSTNTFGGTSTAEYGGLLLSNYPAAGFTITQRYNNFHNTLSNNPCTAPGGKHQ